MTQEPAWGESASYSPPPAPSRPDPDELSPPRPDSSGGGDNTRTDPLGRAAVTVGLIGLVFVGIATAVVAAVLAAEAGRRARDERHSAELAWIALALAGVDGVVFLVLHYAFHLPVWLG